MDDENVIQKYLKFYKQKIEENQDLIINAFVKYYGEEYRELIIHRYDSIQFIYVLNYKNLQKYHDKAIEKDNNLEKQKDIQNVFSIKKLSKRKKTHVIGNDNVSTLIKNEFDKRGALAIAFRKKENKCYVCLPLILLDDKVFFHEVNHIITSSYCLEKINKLGKNCLINQFGLSHNCSDNILIEEFFNHRSYEDILDIFHGLGGILFGIDENITSDYDYGKYLIEPFYREYKELIKKVRITGNTNLLYKFIDEEKYKYFEQCVLLFGEEIVVSKDIKYLSDKVYYIMKLVDSMKRSPKEEAIEAFIFRLQEQGNKIKRLYK